MGTKEECEETVRHFEAMKSVDYVKSLSISHLYPNRNSCKLYRLYIDIEYFTQSNSIGVAVVSGGGVGA